MTNCGCKYENILRATSAIAVLHGTARFKNGRALTVALREGGQQDVVFDRCVISSGASAAVVPIAGLTDTPSWTSTEDRRRHHCSVS